MTDDALRAIVDEVINEVANRTQREHLYTILNCTCLAVAKRVREREREKLAKQLDNEAEKVKHTSHSDGLGMGWQALENRLIDFAATIRSDGEGM